MGRNTRAPSIGDFLDAGDKIGAKFVADAHCERDPSSLRARWEQAFVYCQLGSSVQQGLDVALTLRDTEMWPEIVGHVWNFAMWAGRPEIGQALVEESLHLIEERGDISALRWSWQHVARVYLGLAWAAGNAAEAERRLAGHAELEDTGWRLGEDRDVVVRGPARPVVERFLPATVAAVQGRFVSCGQYTEEYDALLAALFGLSQLPPGQAWSTLDGLEQSRSLQPLGAAYRAQVARRGGDVSASTQWMYSWFADPMFPMSVADLVVTGLVGYFAEVRPYWLAAGP